MKKAMLVIVAVLVVALAMLFSCGQKESHTPTGEQDAAGAEVSTAVSTNELGKVVNKSYEFVDPRTGDTGMVEIERFQASPMWKEMVEGGKLPPIDERLPEEPLVIKPIESIGKYGGWMVNLRTAQRRAWSRALQYEWLVSWTYPYFERLNPNVAKGWEVSPDARKVTFFLRKGMKWSDGTPFTADAITWWFDHIILNDELYPIKPGRFLTRGNLPTVRRLSETTVEFAFTDPYPMFVENMARCRPMSYAPGHYLEQFHPDFAGKEDIEKMMVEGGFDIWADFFRSKWDFHGNPDIPTISGWKAINYQQEVIFKVERNPYYWKVDTEGKQLPYADGMEYALVQNAETWLLKVMAGELTWAFGSSIGGLANLPLVLQNQERGNYRVVNPYWPPNNHCTTYFNFVNSDPAKRKIINDRKFRLALLKAIDWEEVNEIIYDGGAVPTWPRSVAPYDPDSPLFQTHIGRDISEANRLLDEMGLTDKDSDGFRLGPDGKELIFVTVTMTNSPPEAAEVAELYRGYWGEVGVRTVVKSQSPQFVTEMIIAGEYDLHLRWGAPGGRPMNVFTRGQLLPIHRGWLICPPWGRWTSSGGEEGEEPPEYIKRLYAIYEEGMVELSDAKRNDLVMEAFKIYVDHLLMLPGFEAKRATYTVVTKSLRNFSVSDEPYGTTEFAIVPSQTFYFDD